MGRQLPLVANRPERVLGTRKEVTYRELPCRSVLNRCTSERMPFALSINPYRGCELGCRYCYARYTHEFMGMEETRLFETEVFAKVNAPEALERDLRRSRILRGGIAMGTVTDPYQPAERKLLVTRRLLEVFSRSREARGARLSITTKSDLVTRDLDLLVAIARRSLLSVNMTITTLNRRVARHLEPRAPRPARRLMAVRELARAGIVTGVFVMPIVPGITDGRDSLDQIAEAAARAGAVYLAHSVLFLRASAKKGFYPFLAEKYPRLLPRYRRIYSASAYHTPMYRARIDDLMEELRRRHRLAARPPETEPSPQGVEGKARAQLALAF